MVIDSETSGMICSEITKQVGNLREFSFWDNTIDLLNEKQPPSMY